MQAQEIHKKRLSEFQNSVPVLPIKEVGSRYVVDFEGCPLMPSICKQRLNTSLIDLYEKSKWSEKGISRDSFIGMCIAKMLKGKFHGDANKVVLDDGSLVFIYKTSSLFSLDQLLRELHKLEIQKAMDIGGDFDRAKVLLDHPDLLDRPVSAPSPLSAFAKTDSNFEDEMLRQTEAVHRSATGLSIKGIKGDSVFDDYDPISDGSSFFGSANIATSAEDIESARKFDALKTGQGPMMSFPGNQSAAKGRFDSDEPAQNKFISDLESVDPMEIVRNSLGALQQEGRNAKPDPNQIFNELTAQLDKTKSQDSTLMSPEDLLAKEIGIHNVEDQSNKNEGSQKDGFGFDEDAPLASPESLPLPAPTQDSSLGDDAPPYFDSFGFDDEKIEAPPASTNNGVAGLESAAVKVEEVEDKQKTSNSDAFFESSTPEDSLLQALKMTSTEPEGDLIEGNEESHSVPPGDQTKLEPFDFESELSTFGASQPALAPKETLSNQIKNGFIEFDMDYDPVAAILEEAAKKRKE